MQIGRTYSHQGLVLKGCSYPLFVAKLFTDRVICAMGSLLDSNIDAKTWGKRLLQTNADAKSYHGGKATMRDGRSDVDDDGADLAFGGCGRVDVDVL